MDLYPSEILNVRSRNGLSRGSEVAESARLLFALSSKAWKLEAELGAAESERSFLDTTTLLAGEFW